jgi:DNA polymerase
MPRPDRATIDFETRSEQELVGKNGVGAWRYAEDDTTNVLCMSYKMPKRRAKTWVPGMVFPPDLAAWIKADGLCEAHNAQFERAVWKHVLLERNGIPMPKRWMDSMAVCAYKALPLGLDAVGGVLDLDIKKDKRGKYLIQKLCKPRRPTKNDDSKWNDDWDLLEEMYDYCDTDCESEENLSETIGDLPLAEYRTWILDQKINQRGVFVDMDAVLAASEICTMVEDKWNAELYELTGHEVDKATKIAKLKAWCLAQGVELPGLGAEILVDVLENWDIPDNVRRALEIRQEIGKASTKKINKFISCTCKDGKVKGLLQYFGAGTGRWSGRLVQPQNFPRGTIKMPPGGMDELIEDIKLIDPDHLEIKYGSTMAAIAASLRGMMTASPGNRLLVADFSAIEAVVLAWVCNEETKLDVFRNKEDPYCVTASGILGWEVKRSIAKDENHPDHDKHARARQNPGKVCELAFGYQGGVGAWRQFDSKGNLHDDEVNFYKDKWRKNHPNISSSWGGFEQAAIDAVKTGEPHSYNGITFEIVKDKAGTWLTIKLPNDRRLWYFDPELRDDETPWGSPCKKLSYQGKDNKRSGVWGRVETYGGMITENIVQAIARDLMVEAMIQVEKLGYDIILTVHDEIIADVPMDHGSLEEFENAMTYIPPWAEGCPIAVSGWEGHRYRK